MLAEKWAKEDKIFQAAMEGAPEPKFETEEPAQTQPVVEHQSILTEPLPTSPVAKTEPAPKEPIPQKDSPLEDKTKQIEEQLAKQKKLEEELER